MWGKLTSLASAAVASLDDDNNSEDSTSTTEDPAKKPSLTKLVDVDDKEIQLVEQQKLIVHLKELIREKDESLTEKENELKKIDASFSKFKLQAKSKIATLTKQLEDSKKEPTRAVETASTTDSDDGSSIVVTEASSDQSYRAKMIVLKKHIQQKDKQIKELNTKLDNKFSEIECKENIIIQKIEEYDELMKKFKDLESEKEEIKLKNVRNFDSSEDFFTKKQLQTQLEEMVTQMSYKDTKILELINQMTEKEGGQWDLRELVNEKDEAIGLLRASLQENKKREDSMEAMMDRMKWKINDLEEQLAAAQQQQQPQLEHQHHQLTPTPSQPGTQHIQLSESFLLLETHCADLEQRLALMSTEHSELEVKLRKHISDLEASLQNLNLEKVYMENEFKKRIEEKVKEKQEADENCQKIKSLAGSQIKALEKDIESLTQETKELMTCKERLIELEEEKGDLQLQLIDKENKLLKLETQVAEMTSFSSSAAAAQEQFVDGHHQLEPTPLSASSPPSVAPTTNTNDDNNTTSHLLELIEKSKQEIIDLTSKLQENDHVVSQLRMEMSEKDALIVSLQRDSEKYFGENNVELMRMSESIENLKRILSSRDETISELNKTVSQLESDKIKLNDKVKEVVDQAYQKDCELNNANDNLNKNLEELRKLREILKQKNDLLEEVTFKLADVSEVNIQLNDKLKEKRQQLEELNNLNEVYKMHISQKDEEIKVKESSFNECIEKLQEKVKMIASEQQVEQFSQSSQFPCEGVQPSESAKSLNYALSLSPSSENLQLFTSSKKATEVVQNDLLKGTQMQELSEERDSLAKIKSHDANEMEVLLKCKENEVKDLKFSLQNEILETEKLINLVESLKVDADKKEKFWLNAEEEMKHQIELYVQQIHDMQLEKKESLDQLELLKTKNLSLTTQIEEQIMATKAMNDEFEHANLKINKLSEELTGKCDEIEKLEANLTKAELESAQTMSCYETCNKLMEKLKLTHTTTDSAASLFNAFHVFEQFCDAKEHECALLSAQIKNQEEKENATGSHLQSLTAELSSCKELISDQEQLIKETNEKIKDYLLKNEEYKKCLNEKDQEIENLSSELEATVSKLKKLTTGNEKNTSQIEDLEGHIKHLNDKIVTSEENVLSKNKHIEDLEKNLVAFEDLRMQLTTVEQQLVQQQSNFQLQLNQQHEQDNRELKKVVEFLSGLKFDSLDGSMETVVLPPTRSVDEVQIETVRLLGSASNDGKELSAHEVIANFTKAFDERKLQINFQVKGYEQIIEELKQKLKKCDEDYQLLERTLSEQIEKSKSISSELHRESDVLNEQNVSLQNEIKELSEKYNSVLELQSRLQQENETLNKNLLISKEDVSQLNEKIETMNVKIVQLKAETDAKRAEEQEKHNESALDTSMEEKISTAEQLSSEVAELRGKNKKYREKILDRNAKLTSMSKVLEEKEAIIEARKRETIDLENILKEMKQSIVDKDALIESLSTELDATVLKLKEFHEKFEQTLSEEKLSYNNRLGELEKMLAEKNEKIMFLENELEVREKSFNEQNVEMMEILKRDNMNVTKNNEELMKSLKKLNEEFEQMKQLKEKLEFESHEKDKKCQLLNDDVNDLTNLHSQSQALVANLTDEKVQLEKYVTSLNNQVEELNCVIEDYSHKLKGSDEEKQATLSQLTHSKQLLVEREEDIKSKDDRIVALLNEIDDFRMKSTEHEVVLKERMQGSMDEFVKEAENAYKVEKEKYMKEVDDLKKALDQQNSLLQTKDGFLNENKIKLENYEQVINTQNEQIESLMNLKKVKEEELHIKLVELESLKQRSNEHLSASSKEITHFKNELALKKDEVLKLTEALEEKETAFKKCLSVMKKQKESLKELEDALKVSQEQSSSLENIRILLKLDSVESIKDAVKQLVTHNETLLESVSKLETISKEHPSREDFVAVETNVHSLQQDKLELEKQIEEQKLEINQLISNMEELRVGRTKSDEEMMILLKDMNATRYLLRQVEEENSRLIEEVEGHKLNEQKLNEQINELSFTHVENVKKIEGHYNDQMNALHEEINLADVKMKELLTKYDEAMHNSATVSTIEVNGLAEKFETLLKLLNEGEVDSAIQDMDHSTPSYLHSLIQYTEYKLKQLLSYYNQAKEENKTLAENIRSMELSFSKQFSDQVAGVQLTNDDLRARVAELSMEMMLKDKYISELTSSNDQLSSALHSVRADFNKLTDHVVDVEHEVESLRTSSSVPPSKIPVVEPSIQPTPAHDVKTILPHQHPQQLHQQTQQQQQTTYVQERMQGSSSSFPHFSDDDDIPKPHSTGKYQSAGGGGASKEADMRNEINRLTSQVQTLTSRLNEAEKKFWERDSEFSKLCQDYELLYSHATAMKHHMQLASPDDQQCKKDEHSINMFPDNYGDDDVDDNDTKKLLSHDNDLLTQMKIRWLQFKRIIKRFDRSRYSVRSIYRYRPYFTKFAIVYIIFIHFLLFFWCSWF